MDVRGILIDNGYVDLKRQGKDYVLKCWNSDSPAHIRGDKNPSLRVDCDSGIYHCLVCGTKGKLEYKFGESIDKSLDDVMSAIFNLQYGEYFIPEQEEDISLPSDAVFDNSYWIGRGVSEFALEAETIFTSKTMDKRYGGRRTYFAYKDLDGKIFWIEGRDMSEGNIAKYISTVESKKGMYPKDPSVYNGNLIIVEGIGDLLALRSCGLYNVVFSGGIHGLQPSDLDMIDGVFRILIGYDNDAAGDDAALKLEALYANSSVETVRIHLPEDKKDPGSMSAKEIEKCFISRVR